MISLLARILLDLALLYIVWRLPVWIAPKSEKN